MALIADVWYGRLALGLCEEGGETSERKSVNDLGVIKKEKRVGV